MTLGDTGLGTKMETRVGPDSASLRRRSHRIERREAVIQSTGIQLTLDLAYRLLKIAAVSRPRHRLRQLV